MSRLFASDYTISEYRRHISRLYGFFEPLDSIASIAADVEGSRWSHRRSIDLREDLETMGATAEDIDGIERCKGLPAIVPGGLPGFTYVVLGSTLGARIIVKQLQTVLGDGASFRFYGDKEGRYQAAWSLFRADFEENESNEMEAICAMAVGVFGAFALWFSEPLPQSGGC